MFVQRGNEADWKDIGIPGVRMRQLFIDVERDLQTFLLRIDPGTRVPARKSASCLRRYSHVWPASCGNCSVVRRSWSAFPNFKAIQGWQGRGSR